MRYFLPGIYKKYRTGNNPPRSQYFKNETKNKYILKKKKEMLAISCYWVIDTSVMIRLLKSRAITSTQGKAVL